MASRVVSAYCLLSWATLALAAPAAAQESTRTADDTAVRDLVARYVAARELRDPKAVEALFTADADRTRRQATGGAGRQRSYPARRGRRRRTRGCAASKWSRSAS